MTNPLPATNTIYDQVLDGYFGETGTTVTPTTGTGVVFDDTYRSNLWVNYLNSVGISTTDPHLNDILYSTNYYDHTAPKSLVLKEFLAENNIPSNFNINDMSVGSYYWYQYLQSQNLPPTYGPPTPAEITQFTIFAFQLRGTITSNFSTFAANFQANLQQNFVLYIQRTLFDLQTQQANMSSADEIKQRTIMFETFEILLKMLVSLQDTVGVVGKNLIFFGKWQEQYTNMLTRVPIYTGGTSPNVTLSNPVDPLKMTFGYNNISVDDIANWYATQQQNGTSNTFTIASQLNKTIDVQGQDIQTRTSLKIVVNPNGQSAIYMTQELIRLGDGGEEDNVYDGAGNIVELGKFQLTSGPGSNYQVIIGPSGGSGDFTTDADNFKTAFQTYINRLPSQSTLLGYVDPDASSSTVNIPTLYRKLADGTLEARDFPGNDHIRQLNLIPVFEKDTWEVFARNADGIKQDIGVIGNVSVPWDHTFNDSTTDKDRADQESKARGEINARNQQYIENIRSRRQIVQDNAKQIESALSQAKESISEMANLLTSIMDSLKGLIGSIFR